MDRSFQQLICPGHLGTAVPSGVQGLVHGMKEALHLAYWQLLWRQGPKFTTVNTSASPTVRLETYCVKGSNNW